MTVSTVPAGLPAEVTYNGQSNLPVNAGSYSVLATVNSANYTGSGTGTLVIGKASNVITAFAPIGTRTNGAPPFAITLPTATSSLPVSVTVKSGPASILSNVVTMTGVGTVTLAANQAASANYLAAAEVTTSFSVARGGQSVTFGAIAGKVVGDAAFALNATASSGLPVSYSSVSTNISLSGGNVTILGAGTATIVASQGGDSNHLAATPVTNTLVIGKGVASVSFSGTSAIYSGVGRAVTVSTVPAGLPVGVTYNGKTNLPVNAGSYAVVATINSPNYAGSGTGTLVVDKATSSVVLSGLSQTYNGAGRAVTVRRVPASLPVGVTYNGQTNPPVNAGSYSVLATINSPNYTGSGTGTLVIGKGAATVSLGGLSQSYNGSGRAVTVRTVPAGLPVEVTYNGQTNLPVNAGSYAVAASINSPNYTGSRAGTLVIRKATTKVKLSNLRQIYNGNERPVTVTTTPSNIPVIITYRNGSAVPVNAGNYRVMATVDDTNYSGAATSTLSVARATQTITFAPASPVNFSTNGVINLEATSSSGLPVTYTSSIPAVLSISGSTASMKKRGSSIIRATQAGNSNLAPATSVRKIITVK